MDGSYLLCGGAVPEKVDTWKRTADGHGVGAGGRVVMRGISGDVVIRIAVPPVYGVVVSLPGNNRDGNGFVGSFRFPSGDEGFGFRFGLCLPEEYEEECGNDKKGTF
ncbi:MAG: hypothetical protein GDA42_12175 [Ekhidna sp.]|nr:hypothetical protein [Ekhidna sp.]